ncbi:MAG: hypothetical protein KAI83_07870 [Thiomargarita sp.]|nr:hypothetical protein [Thiomargarita sp.]
MGTVCRVWGWELGDEKSCRVGNIKMESKPLDLDVPNLKSCRVGKVFAHLPH